MLVPDLSNTVIDWVMWTQITYGLCQSLDVHESKAAFFAF